jgi:hypothetical protein
MPTAWLPLLPRRADRPVGHVLRVEGEKQRSPAHLLADLVRGFATR